MSPEEKPKRLGRGLEALLGPVNKDAEKASGNLRDLPLAQIEPNPYQPRTRFDATKHQELADSIAASGLLQPIVVRMVSAGKYQIIAGERRWRAMKSLGMTSVPAVVKSVDDKTLLTLAMIENLQRHDLSPIDEALGYKRMQDEFGIGTSEIARLTGKNRSTVANLLRLLNLPDDVRDLVHAGELSEGHARALLAFEDATAIRKAAHDAIEGAWTVRMVEAAARGEVVVTTPSSDGEETPKSERRKPTAKVASADAQRVEDALRKHLGTDVSVRTTRSGRGAVTLAFYSNDDLARLLELLLGEPYSG